MLQEAFFSTGVTETGTGSEGKWRKQSIIDYSAVGVVVAAASATAYAVSTFDETRAKAEVVRIEDKAAMQIARAQAEVARIQAQAQAEVARIQDEAATGNAHTKEVAARIQAQAQAEVARVEGERKLSERAVLEGGGGAIQARRATGAYSRL